MILGTGIDLIEIDRIKKAIERWGDHFLTHIFCKEEIEYAQKHTYPAVHYAARFAAKEAVFKALQDQTSIGWKDIKIINDENGRPRCIFNNQTFKDKIIISISHTRNYAVASAIITS